ncbi:MAG TPA: energy transducer TonB [Allosphingosinicella sp.]|nr:energy transducer TonB [Allosphingosinicella sp.]
MPRARSLFVALALAAPASAPLAAQPPAPAPAVPPWQVDWGSHFCSLIRQPAAGRPYAAALLTVPGSNSSSLLLVPEGNATLPRGIDTAVLMPGGRAFPLRAFQQRRGTAQVLQITGFPYDLRGLLEGAEALELRAGTEVRLRIPVDQSRAALAAHRECTAGIARQWGIDEAALAALRERPFTTNGFGFRSSDYPQVSLSDRNQGRVILRVMVAADGRAAECSVVATSGDPQIDDRSCRVVRARARFTPGRDASGRPVAIASVFTVTWLVPGAR